MKLRLVIEKDEKTGRWSAVFPEIPGCASAGDTEKEAILNAREAVDLWFEPVPLKLSKRTKLIKITA
ncbi:MAG: type II toxin-antitoxin system HicB family antitoxin [bacterium]